MLTGRSCGSKLARRNWERTSWEEMQLLEFCGFLRVLTLCCLVYVLQWRGQYRLNYFGFPLVHREIIRFQFEDRIRNKKDAANLEVAAEGTFNSCSYMIRVFGLPSISISLR